MKLHSHFRDTTTLLEKGRRYRIEWICWLISNTLRSILALFTDAWSPRKKPHPSLPSTPNLFLVALRSSRSFVICYTRYIESLPCEFAANLRAKIVCNLCRDHSRSASQDASPSTCPAISSAPSKLPGLEPQPMLVRIILEYLTDRSTL